MHHHRPPAGEEREAVEAMSCRKTTGRQKRVAGDYFVVFSKRRSIVHDSPVKLAPGAGVGHGGLCTLPK